MSGAVSSGRIVAITTENSVGPLLAWFSPSLTVQIPPNLGSTMSSITHRSSDIGLVNLRYLRLASATVVVVAAAFVFLPGAGHAQKAIALSRSKHTRTDTTRADTTRARTARADSMVVARADTVIARRDPARTDTTRVQAVASDTTAAVQGDVAVADTTRTAITLDSVAPVVPVETDSAPTDSTVNAAVQPDPAVIQADSVQPDSAAVEAVSPDSTDGASVEMARIDSMVAPAADAVRTSFVANRPRRPSSEFAEKHLNYDRVLGAKVEKRFELKRLFRERGMSFPADEMFLRVFKRERLLEVWVRTNGQAEFAMLKSYRICALGTLVGPKRVQGDGQTPEGFYYIDGFNPMSGFHLSLKIDYPNRSDRLRSDGQPLGGDIFIHGGCKTLGCLAVTDDAIKELYWLAVEARDAGQRIAVHIFPTKLTDDALAQLKITFDKRPELKQFWSNLKPGYDYFEENHRLPSITIDDRGWYQVKSGEPALAVPVAGGEPAHAKMKN